MLGWIKTLTKKFNKLPAIGQFAVAILIMVIVRYLLHLVIYSNFLSNYLENFGNPKELVYFHMNGCGHCDKMKPEWNKFKASYTGPIELKEVEQAQMSDQQKEWVQGFPTLVLVENGKVLKTFEGERTEAGFKSFLG